MEKPTLTVIRCRIPRYGETYILDHTTREFVGTVPGRVEGASRVFLGVDLSMTDMEELNNVQKKALIEVLTGLRGSLLDPYQVVLLERDWRTGNDQELPGWMDSSPGLTDAPAGPHSDRPGGGELVEDEQGLPVDGPRVGASDGTL